MKAYQEVCENLIEMLQELEESLVAITETVTLSEKPPKTTESPESNTGADQDSA